MTRYRWVDSQKAKGYPVAAACAAAGVTRSAHYAWTSTRRGGPTPRQRADTRLMSAIRRIHTASDGTYGAPRVTRELRDGGQRVNHKRVERLMHAHSPRRCHRCCARQ